MTFGGSTSTPPSTWSIWRRPAGSFAFSSISRASAAAPYTHSFASGGWTLPSFAVEVGMLRALFERTITDEELYVHCRDCDSEVATGIRCQGCRQHRSVYHDLCVDLMPPRPFVRPTPTPLERRTYATYRALFDDHHQYIALTLETDVAKEAGLEQGAHGVADGRTVHLVADTGRHYGKHRTWRNALQPLDADIADGERNARGLSRRRRSLRRSSPRRGSRRSDRNGDGC